MSKVNCLLPHNYHNYHHHHHFTTSTHLLQVPVPYQPWISELIWFCHFPFSWASAVFPVCSHHRPTHSHPHPPPPSNARNPIISTYRIKYKCGLAKGFSLIRSGISFPHFPGSANEWASGKVKKLWKPLGRGYIERSGLQWLDRTFFVGD